MTELLAFLAGFAAGACLLAWRVSKRTGVPMLDVLRGKPGEERKEAQRGKPGEEGP